MLHPALRIDEILRKIFAYLSADRQSVARVARTCKVFSDVALCLLWSELESLLPLLRLFPTFVRVPEDSPKNQKKYAALYVLHGSSDQQWERFLCYAGRVHVLRHVVLEYRVHPSVFPQLILRARGQPIFTALRSLEWEEPFPLSMELIGFLSPSLRDITISVRVKDGHSSMVQDGVVSGVVGTLLSHAPSLEYLYIDAMLPLGAVQMLGCFAGLRYLTVGSQLAPQEVMTYFGHMENLKELAVVLGRSESYCYQSRLGVPTTTERPSAEGSFPALRALDVMGEFRFVRELMSAIPSDGIESLSINGMDGTGWHDYHETLNVLASKFAKTLRKLELLWRRHCCEPVPGVNDWPKTFEAIRPLLKVRLADVQLKFHGIAITLTAEDIHDMAVSWRTLTSLRISTCGAVVEVPPAHSLNLCTLALPTLLPEFSSTRDTKLHPVLPHGLQELLLADNSEFWKHDVREASRFLFRLFPDVQLGVTDSDSDSCLRPMRLNKALAKLRTNLKDVRRREGWISSC
ncbi:hypothetical protein BKA93DRAFT_748409 [Sparassis latifolia]